MILGCRKQKTLRYYLQIYGLNLNGPDVHRSWSCTQYLVYFLLYFFITYQCRMPISPSAPYHLRHTPNKKFKIQHCTWLHFCFMDAEIQKWLLYASDFDIQNVIFILHLSFWKVIFESELSSRFSYPELCVVNGVEDRDLKLIYVCLLILICRSHLCCLDKL